MLFRTAAAAAAAVLTRLPCRPPLLLSALQPSLPSKRPAALTCLPRPWREWRLVRGAVQACLWGARNRLASAERRGAELAEGLLLPVNAAGVREAAHFGDRKLPRLAAAAAAPGEDEAAAAAAAAEAAAEAEAAEPRERLPMTRRDGRQHWVMAILTRRRRRRQMGQWITSAAASGSPPPCAAPQRVA